MSRTLIFVVVVAAVLTTSISSAADWPQFRGPDRDGKSPEQGLMQRWPKNGPRQLWCVTGLGKGCASIAIAGQTVYTTGLHGRTGYVFAFDTAGRLKWKKSYGPEWTGLFAGARTTPTVDGDRLYVISGAGRVVCMNTADGRTYWSVDTVRRFAADCGKLGMTESPLLVDDKVICTPGGPDATIAASTKRPADRLDLRVDGQKTACCSPILVRRGLRKIIVTMLQDCVVGVDAVTGRLLWSDCFHEYQHDADAINFVSPIYADGLLYTTSGDNDGGAMYELNHDGTGITRRWIDETLDCHHGGVVQVGGFIFGANYRSLWSGDWVCLDWQTGRVMYEEKWHSKGSAIYADGMLYCYEEKKGHVALVRSTPRGFEIVSTFQVRNGDGRHLAHPAIADGTLYIRRGDSLTAYDIRESAHALAK